MKRFYLLFFLLLLLLITNCAINKQLIKTSEPSKIILITLDGVRWQEMFDDKSPIPPYLKVDSRKLMPHIYHHFVDNGIVIGKYSEIKLGNSAHMSLPGYYEILSGKITDCINNECESNTNQTLVNYFQNDAVVFGSWKLIDQVIDNTKSYVNTGNLDAIYRSDLETIKVINQYLATFQQPKFLWVSLGNTDEWAHDGSYDNYLSSLQLADNFIDQIVKQYQANSSIIITTDHGRGIDWRQHGLDELSGRVWLLLCGKNIDKLGFIKLNETVYSYDIAPTILDLVGERNNRSLLKKSYVTMY